MARLVFVDASHPDQIARLSAVAPKLEQSLTMAKVAAALSWTGLVRVALPASVGPTKEPAEAVRAMAAFAPTSLGPMLAEQESIEATFAEAGSFRQLGDRPVVVLTALAPMSDTVLKTLELSRDQATRFQAVWRELHEEEASWSMRSRHQLVTDASHYIQFDRPDVVIDAVRSVVETVRAGR